MKEMYNRYILGNYISITKDPAVLRCDHEEIVNDYYQTEMEHLEKLDQFTFELNLAKEINEDLNKSNSRYRYLNDKLTMVLDRAIYAVSFVTTILCGILVYFWLYICSVVF